MAIDFNHTILSARDSDESARFLAEMLGLPAPQHWGPFRLVTTHNGANVDYIDHRTFRAGGEAILLPRTGRWRRNDERRDSE